MFTASFIEIKNEWFLCVCNKSPRMYKRIRQRGHFQIPVAQLYCTFTFGFMSSYFPVIRIKNVPVLLIELLNLYQMQPINVIPLFESPVQSSLWMRVWRDKPLCNSGEGNTWGPCIMRDLYRLVYNAYQYTISPECVCYVDWLNLRANYDKQFWYFRIEMDGHGKS